VSRCDFYQLRVGNELEDYDLCVICGEHREICGHEPRPLTAAEEDERQRRLQGTNFGSWGKHRAPRRSPPARPAVAPGDFPSREVSLEELQRRIAAKAEADNPHHKAA